MGSASELEDSAWRDDPIELAERVDCEAVEEANEVGVPPGVMFETRSEVSNPGVEVRPVFSEANEEVPLDAATNVTRDGVATGAVWETWLVDSSTDSSDVSMLVAGGFTPELRICEVTSILVAEIVGSCTVMELVKKS